MIALSLNEKKQQKKLAAVWGMTFIIAFPLLITLGLLMRLGQGELINTAPNDFYVYMTLHGLGMIGVLFSIAFSGLWYLLSTRYIKLNIKMGYFIFITILISIVGLVIGTLIGKFGPGWYMLYPLPFSNAGSWSAWSILVSSISLLVLGLAWIIGIFHVLSVMAKEYGGYANILGWQYLKKEKPKRELPPVIMITAIALIPNILAVIAAAILIIMFIMQVFEPSLAFDALTMKNLVMFYGHTIANCTMYMAVGWVYLLLPEFTGRKIAVNKVLVLSWNATFFFITLAFFHHMYMDFVQPLPFQYLAQVVSYASAVPATAITMFTVISQLYHSRVKWGVVPLMFLIGIAGWAIGGFSAVVDSTIAFNTVLHNTLWVPAHFHTYMLMGVVPFIFGYLYYIFSSKNNLDGGKLTKFGFWIFAIGAYGFLILFYLGGLNSIPRRYSSYSAVQIDHISSFGALLAVIAVWFISLLSVGLLIMYFTLFVRMFKKKTPEYWEKDAGLLLVHEDN